jgi:hypothetical protein
LVFLTVLKSLAKILLIFASFFENDKQLNKFNY